ncbi:MAG: hypothetical protein LBP98_06515 [Tannerella sp.]|jgi:hypothetical protein|nr:hypothetical protein [Tannerella sp.]
MSDSFAAHSFGCRNKKSVGENNETDPCQWLWVNPDCGLQTRNRDETVPSLKDRMQAAKKIRNTMIAAPDALNRQIVAPSEDVVSKSED